jgi:hypothetical protein
VAICESGSRIRNYGHLNLEVMKVAFLSIIALFVFTSAFSQAEKSADTTVDDPVGYIKQETIGGKLDFNQVLDREKKALYEYDGIAYNKKDFAIFLWAQAVKRLGISSSKRAARLWEEINKRPLTEPEEKALKSGFKADIK